jgi:Tfp pilus assembly protein PilP
MKILIFMLPIIAITAHASDSPIESILTEEAIHALRDPFHAPNVVLFAKETPRSDLELYALKEFKLNGVITGARKAKAMITLPNSKTFFISVGDKVGVREGHVVSISGDSIRVVEYDHDESGKAVPEIFKLSISGEIISLTEKKEEL